MNDAENFDGALVLVADGYLQEGFWDQPADDGRLNLYDYGSESFLPVRHKLARAIGARQLAQKGDLFLDNSSPDAVAWYDNLRALADQDLATVPENKIRETIMDGRIQLALLIDMPQGGLELTRRKITGLTDHVRKNGGRVSSFAGVHAIGAGASLFMNGDRDRRFVIPRSQFTFKLNSSRLDSSEALLKKRWRELCGLLINNARANQHDCVMAILDIAERGSLNPLVEMDGEKTDELGLANIAWLDPSKSSVSLMGTFAEELGIPLNAIEVGTPARNLFERAGRMTYRCSAEDPLAKQMEAHKRGGTGKSGPMLN
ncbi:MAG: hypothetical protein AAB606_05480 [Patescibacteria group bacterium]